VLQVAERCLVFDLAGRPVQKTGLQLDHHEHLLWHSVFAAYAKTGGGREAETLVLRVPQHNNSAAPELLALFLAGAHKGRPNALALMF
jgi:hypothetical protein